MTLLPSLTLDKTDPVKLKAVSFDAAGTLLDPVVPIGESYAELASRHGMDVSSGEIDERFRICFADSPPLAFPKARGRGIEDLERAWWRDVVRRVFAPFGPFPRFESYFADLFVHFGKAESWRLCPHARKILAALKERNLILLMVSNFDSRLLAILEGHGIASCFDSVVLSSRAGHAKPSPAIFHLALRRHDLTPHEAMHVGDSLENDAVGADAAGLRAVWLNRNGGGARWALQVRALDEILPLVDRFTGAVEQPPDRGPD
jgi:putative hydrolase of the HAD superfamily